MIGSRQLTHSRDLIRGYFSFFVPTESDASWAIQKATAAVSGVQTLLAASPPERFG